MFVIVGWLLALACVFGVFIAHGGNIGVVLKALPFEMTTIAGAAAGAFLAANPMKVVKASMSGVVACMKGSKHTKTRYLELLGLLYGVLQKARKDGMMSIESDVEDPGKSALFAKFPNILADHHVMEFITDYLRMMVTGNLNAHEIETHHQEGHAPVAAVTRLAGGLPAFGIVAAVLGVVNTMGSVGQPPAILGAMIGSALVGTFLGILLSYAIVEPLSGMLEHRLEEGTKELQCVKATLLASMQGYSPQVAIEFGRKVLFSDMRPKFLELEAHVKRK